MGIRFSKSVKLNNLLRLNFSKSGVSATVGKKGASVNIGGKGTYLNLSPAAVGISGTGLSYRTKLGKKKKSSKTAKETKETKVEETKTTSLKKKGEEVKEETVEETVDTSIIDEYNKTLDLITNLHKYGDDVLTKEEFRQYVEEMEDGIDKEIHKLSIDGEEDIVENMISSTMSKLSFPYDVRVNYELEDNVLYVDLDLPEIESFSYEYPVLSKAVVVYKKKTNNDLKEEYAKAVMSLGIFLSATYFNLSSYIDEIVISAFTTRRNSDGDLEDQYLYSVKFERKVFEETELAEVDDAYAFINKFENRINLSTNYTFKAIKPYESEAVVKTNSLIDEAVLGLKQLGYKSADIDRIYDKLSEYQYESSGDYLKEALRLIKE